MQSAARKDFTNKGDPEDASFANREIGPDGRTKYVKEETINVYPDTLCWIHDFPYSYNEPLTKSYFWHPTYDNYPVVGVNWSQARAFVYGEQHCSTVIYREKDGLALMIFVFLPKPNGSGLPVEGSRLIRSLGGRTI